MQTLLLACYICLQLTSLPSDSNFGDLLKRDTACDQCLTGLFDSSDLTFDHRVQTTGELLLSDKDLQETLEKRLIDELHTRSMLWPRKQPQETTKDVGNAKMMVEDMLQTTEIAMKAMQEKAVEEMKSSLQEMILQLDTQQEQLRNELNLVGNRQPVMENQNTKRVIYDVSLLEVKMPNKNTLRNEEKLAVGESLMSENGRFRATMENSGLVVITDQTKGGRIVKTFGEPRSDNPESELYLTLQSNGNLVIKDEEMSIWHSGRLSPKAGRSHFLKLENDGQMVMYNGWNYRVWTSGFPE